MSVLVLVCRCGQRIKAPGATPGRVGRCPKCGESLKVPEAVPPARREENETTAAGYYVEEIPRLTSSRAVGEASSGSPTRDSRPTEAGRTTRRSKSKPGARQSQTSESSLFVYPLSAAESVSVITILSTAFWIFTVLVPEYCLTLMSDADSMGAGPMGSLVSLITALPALFLLLPALFYGVQYLGRILVSSALGENAPPRPPDRNFDGFLNGLGPWVLWLFGGVTVGGLPLACYWISQVEAGTPNWVVVFALALLGLPYSVMALLMTFLHDDAFAAKPPAVIAAMARAGFMSFAMLCLGVGSAIGLVAGAFALMMELRAQFYWGYVVAGVAFWAFVLWIAMVVMRLLGLYYYRRRKTLRWHQARPRWGVNWGI